MLLLAIYLTSSIKVIALIFLSITILEASSISLDLTYYSIIDTIILKKFLKAFFISTAPKSFKLLRKK